MNQMDFEFCSTLSTCHFLLLQNPIHELLRSLSCSQIPVASIRRGRLRSNTGIQFCLLRIETYLVGNNCRNTEKYLTIQLNKKLQVL